MSICRPAVFLDRDGVLNHTVVRDGVTHPPDSLADFEFLPGAEAACQQLAAAGWLLVVVTNQPDVARGRQLQSKIEEIHDYVRSTLPVEAIYACYHDTPDNCDCRKPKPGMILAAAGNLNIDLERSFLVGDRWSDIVAGQSAGCTSILVETPFSRPEKCEPAAGVPNLKTAVEWILNQQARRAG